MFHFIVFVLCIKNMYKCFCGKEQEKQPINQGYEYHGVQTICGNYSCATSSEQIWAQPYVPGVWTGPWGWYQRGAYVGNDSGYTVVTNGGSTGYLYRVTTGNRNGILGYWATSYGVQPGNLN